MKGCEKIIVKVLIMIVATMFCGWAVTPEIPFIFGWKIALCIWIISQFKDISDSIKED